MNIDWQLPELRAGVKGKVDSFIGPGATDAEKALQLYVPFVSSAALLLWAWYGDLGWSVFQFVVAGMLAVDIVGGIITNATSSAKRWFHRDGQGFKQHMSFIALHFVQLSLFSWAFLQLDVWWVLLTGTYMLVACAWVLKTPLYLQRPVALILYSFALVLTLTVFDAPPGLAWFLPLFYLKLLISHILREEPYRPDLETKQKVENKTDG
ncbi:hypothetical protein [Agarivorans sp. JK6]|uniref:hypothetical protein n=1 Tax=Agarivorans sp. JK6 TaxID=2997426 RepID=UPI003872AD0B